MKRTHLIIKKRVSWPTIFATFLRIVAIIFILTYADFSFAHEQWFLTAQQIHDLNAEPKPSIFTQWTSTNSTICFMVFLLTIGWIMLGRTGGKELFPDHQIKLASWGYTVSVFLRITTAVMLLMAVFGLNPRSGVALFSVPTLIFPDLLLTSSSMWLKWVELGIGLGLILDIYVRFMALLLLGITFIGLYLFGSAMIYYIGFVTAISLYLIFQGPGFLYLSLPNLMGAHKIYQFLKNQPCERAQFLLRVLTGLSFAYTGFIVKFLHPNLAIGLLTMRHMPTFGLDMETIVLWMAFVETLSGVLLTM